VAVDWQKVVSSVVVVVAFVLDMEAFVVAQDMVGPVVGLLVAEAFVEPVRQGMAA